MGSITRGHDASQGKSIERDKLQALEISEQNHSAMIRSSYLASLDYLVNHQIKLTDV